MTFCMFLLDRRLRFSLYSCGQNRTKSPVVADQVGALLDPGSFAFRCADIDFLEMELSTLELTSIVKFIIY